MNNMRLLGVRRIDQMNIGRIRELWGLTKGVNERVGESVLRWFGKQMVVIG